MNTVAMDKPRNAPQLTPNTFGSSHIVLCRDGLTVSTVTLDAGLAFASHAHDRDQLCVVLEGRYEERDAAGVVALRPGSVLWRRAGKVHSNRVGMHDVEVVLADIEPDRSRRLRLHSTGCDAYFLPGTFDEIYRELLFEARRSDPASRLALEALVCLLAARIGRRCKLPVPAAMPEWLSAAAELIRSEYSEKLTLSQVAAASGVHRATVAVGFRRYFGKSVGDYITDLRVAHALQELEKTRRPIAEIALEAGFYDESHMGRVFRRRFRVSPGALRRIN
jgi:AraC family transcriptional regulator